MRRYFLILISTVAFAGLARAEDSTNAAPATNAVATVTNAAPVVAAVTNAPATNVVIVSTNAPVDPRSFEAFKLIIDRNIFDPNRRPRRPNEIARTESTRPVRTETLSLVGAMAYNKGAFAFFDGSRSEYRKSVKAGDSIADYKVASVTSTNVALEMGDKKVNLPVGSQLRKRGDEGQWELSSSTDTSETNAPFSSDSSSTNSTSSAKSDSPSTDAASDALKRLLERRNREK